MKAVTFYDIQGRFTMSLHADDSTVEHNITQRGEPWVEGEHYGRTDVYAHNGKLTVRPANPATLDGMTLRNLPHGTIVHINDTPYVCDDGYAELEFTQPGKYKVRVECWPYLDKEFTVENPA